MGADSGYEDLFPPHPQINAACESGDVSALRTLFAEFNVQPDHDTRPKDERPPVGSVNGLLYTARTQPAVCEFLGSCFNVAAGIWPYVTSQAIENANLEMLRAIGKLDPKGLDSPGSKLGEACSSKHDPLLKSKIIRVMLESGADPDASAEPHPIFPNDLLVIMCGVPDTTMEDFFDHGYSFKYAHIKAVMEYKRAGILEIIYRRGRQLYPDSQDLPLPGPKQLMRMCKATNDEYMVATARKLFSDELGKQDRSLFRSFRKHLSGLHTSGKSKGSLIDSHGCEISDE